MPAKEVSPYIINMVSIGKDVIRINYDVVKEDGNSSNYTLECTDRARKMFYDRMEELAPHVISLLELEGNEDPQFFTRIHPKTVKFSHDETGDMSASIEADLEVPRAHARAKVKTPTKHAPKDPKKDTSEVRYLFPRTVEALMKVQEEAVKYIRGDRAEVSLFADSKDK